ncbi:MAG TPA: sensor histidine kinase, partial [Spirochaetia bacterium]|nr:sensor histidine kinase [Spirochaetia bacterium]
RYLTTAYLFQGGQGVVEGLPYVGVDSLVERYRAKIEASGGRVVWLPTEGMQSIYGDRFWVFGVARPIRSDNRVIAVLLLLFRENLFRDIFQEVGWSQGVRSALVTPDGTVVTSSDRSQIGGHLAPVLSGASTLQAGESVSMAETAKELIVASRSSVNGWSYAAFTPRSVVFRDLHVLQNIVFVTILGSFVIFFVLSLYFSRSLTGSLRMVGSALERIGSGDFSTRIHYQGRDEMRMLTDTVNLMTGRIQGLLRQVAEEEKAKERAELRWLQMQVSPHFLYNTLNTIRWMAVVNRQDNIKKMVTALSRLLRGVADAERATVSLRDELKFVESYVYIQKMRYSSFEVSIEVPEGLRDLQIEKFALQNLVENSIVHGFAGRERSGHVRIAAWLDNSNLCVSISDDGRGFDPSAALTAQSGLDRDHNHSGIQSIERRIRLHHGNGYGLHVESTAGKGTTVIVRVPAILSGESR